jgi:predicted nucleic acid-binding protein
MGQIRSYLDSSVIINVFSKDRRLAERSLAVIDDSSRQFVVGDYVKLETLPKMIYNRQDEQAIFARNLFQRSEYVQSSGVIVAKAEKMAEQYGLACVDALHAASAIEGGADELLTFEKPGKPFFRIPPDVLKVVSLHSEARSPER